MQIQPDPDLTEMIARAETYQVLGLELPVKNILDIGRLVARFVDLRQEVPPELAQRLDAVTNPEETE
ncbi:MAG: hypothetical protein ABI939_08610 [Anaerolineaceae bacterium]